ncbi:hypothetical protein CTI12_AA315780 [Artemisia annua]|uniref:CCHC-type domain-containing protein n=1 Tax=Artemisia annua TaxID=35608 RepID=A0A2U1N2S0_ARTAN|nr:hypothetical protein CTI12_AA315780 [Artemisia annua]
MFLVKIDHVVDLRRVLEDGPRSFKSNLVVLKLIDNDEQPIEAEMMKVAFWIRLLNMPLSRRDEPSVRYIASKLGEVVEVDNAYFANRSKHIRAKVMINITNPLCRYVTVLNLQNIKVRVHIQYERLPNFCYWCGLLGHTEKECLTKPLAIDGKTFKDWPFQEWLQASNSKEDGSFGELPHRVLTTFNNNQEYTKEAEGLLDLRLSNQEVVLHGDDKEGKNKKVISEYSTGDLELVETGTEVLQRSSNFERLKKDCLRNVEDEVNETNMGVKEVGHPKDFNGSSITLPITCHLVAKKNNEGRMAKYESGPTAATKIVTEVKTPNTSQLKTWKRHNRGGTENNYSAGTVNEIHGGKRSYDICADGDKMDRGTGIYGWPKQQDKHRTWTLLRSLKTDQIQAWLCFGDFNEILYACEKMGRRGSNIIEMTSFLDAYNFCNLEDMSACGVKYTWSNKRRGEANVKKRLDRFLANLDWLELYPVASFQNLARVSSDHFPIVCRLVPFQRALREEIKELLTREEIMWKQRSRVQWLREGDKNTRFFHSRASNQREHNNILRLKDEDGRWVENEEDLCTVSVKYLSNLFSSSSPQSCSSVVEDIDQSLTDNDRVALERQVTSTEVHEALM